MNNTDVTSAQVIKNLENSLKGSRVPSHNHDGIIRYIVFGINPGSFMTSVLMNDLRGAVSNADGFNSLMLPEIVKWLYSYAPYGCWGSIEAVENWNNKRGLKGINTNEGLVKY